MVAKKQAKQAKKPARKSAAVGRAAPVKGMSNTHSLPEVEVTCTPEGSTPPREYRTGARVQVDEFQLTARERRFADEYLIDLKARPAALRAGYAESSAQVQADRMLKNPYVSAYIRMRQAEASERTGIKQDALLQRLEAMSRADVNELVEFRRGACRHCWGRDHRYQYTPAEYERQRKLFEEKQNADPKLAEKEFDVAGGIGFNPNKPPHPECPECHGEGEGRTIFKDTGRASPEARALYMGMKETQHGLEVKITSPLEAVKLLGDHLGMWAPQKHEHQHKGKVEHAHKGKVDMEMSPSEAYMELVRGS